MTLYEKAAGLLMPRLGSNMPPPVTVEEDAARVERLLERCPVGGLVLFNGHLPATPATLARLQAHSPRPLLVATDMERGVGQQVAGATVFPHALAFGALGDEAEALTEAAARVAAREALACGIHVAFAPVADVHRQASNPIIATRAFASSPEAAARLVRAYVRGCQAEGLLTTAKHFPGHGATREDSHTETPVVLDDAETLSRTDIVPFRAAIGAGADLVMTAHVAFPALDPSGRPATLSRPILRDLLRERLGFEGVVVTDSLLMGGIQAPRADEGAQAVALVQAGVDLLLDVQDPEAMAQALAQAIEAGTLEEALVDASLERLEALRTRLAKSHGPDWARPAQKMTLPEPAGTALAGQVARRAVTVIEAAPGAVPMPTGEAPAVVLIKPFRTRLDPSEEPLGAAVRAAWPSGSYVEVGPEADAETLEALRHRLQGASRVVLAIVAKPAAWHASGLTADQQAFAEALIRQQPTVAVALGNPYVLEELPGAVARLCTYSDAASSQRALVAALVS